jgi:hypothetical protein
MKHDQSVMPKKIETTPLRADRWPELLSPRLQWPKELGGVETNRQGGAWRLTRL